LQKSGVGVIVGIGEGVIEGVEVVRRGAVVAVAVTVGEGTAVLQAAKQLIMSIAEVMTWICRVIVISKSI
jgi:hypothetical protein